MIGKNSRQERSLERYIRWSERLIWRVRFGRISRQTWFQCETCFVERKVGKSLPGFYDWFLKHQKEKFENSVIASARGCSNVWHVLLEPYTIIALYWEKNNASSAICGWSSTIFARFNWKARKRWSQSDLWSGELHISRSIFQVSSGQFTMALVE